LLGFKKNKTHKPVNTHIIWNGVCNIDERKLICIYKRLDTEEWRTFEREELMTHKMLDYCVPIDKNIVVYVFDFNIYKEDYDTFLRGRYSKLSSELKKKITDYYGVNTPEWIFIESYIFPEKYFAKYAELLGVNVNDLIKTGELCDRYDLEKETCVLKHPEIHTT